MKLADLLSSSRAVVPLEATTLGEAASLLLERLVATGSVADPEKLRRRAAEERAEDVVALADRAFVLHYRTDAVREIAVAIGTARAPICRTVGEGERQCARVVVVVLAPPRMAARFLQIVGAFARLLSKPETTDAIAGQPTAAALLALRQFATFELPEQLTVRDLMTERPHTVSPETPLRDAARQMVRSGVGGLPVVDADRRVVGMLSERDLLRHFLNSYLLGGDRQRLPHPPTSRRAVRDVMTRQVLCVSPEQPLAEVASLMAHKDVERVPVVRDGALVGFLTRGDIVRKLTGS